MRRLLMIAIVSLTATAALADRDRWRAGTEGTVTAYEADGRTVIENKQCFRTSSRHRGYDYSSCSRRLRDDVKRELCRKNGGGTHTYYFQMGDNRPTRSSVYCGRSRY
jgi:hypothetical protein